MVQGLAHFLVLAAEEYLAKRMTVGGENAAGPDGYRQQGGTGQSAGRALMVSTTQQTHDPRLGSAENLHAVRPDDHLTGRIECANPGKDALRPIRLVGNKINPEGAGLAVDPLVERATHPAAPVVEYLDASDFLR